MTKDERNFRGDAGKDKYYLLVFERIYENQYNKLIFYALRFVNDACAAEEIVGDAMLCLWEKREQLDLLNGISSYLYTAVKNKCLNYLQHQKIVMAFAGSVAKDDSKKYSGKDVQQDLINKELLTKVYQEIDRLPDRCFRSLLSI